jgi:hypothetical protein
MKIRAGILTAGLVAAGLIGAAVPATADTKSWTCTSVYGGEACFRSYGDDISVRDTVADGYRAVAVWTVNYSRSTPDCVDSDGADNGRTICYHDMRETGTIAFKIEIRDGSRPVRGSDYVQMHI